MRKQKNHTSSTESNTRKIEVVDGMIIRLAQASTEDFNIWGTTTKNEA